MPDLGRWFGMDQLSEKFHTASPYAYVMNNPAMLIDPDGRDAMFSSGTEEILNQYMVNTYWKKSSSLVPGYSGSALFGFSGINAPTQYSSVSRSWTSSLTPGKLTFDFDYLGTDSNGDIVGDYASIVFTGISSLTRWTMETKAWESKALNNNFARNIVPDYSTVADGNSDVSMNGNPGFRFPDFYTVNISIGGMVGWNGTITLDRHGQIYISPIGGTLGKSATLISGSLTANWLLQRNKPSASETYSFLSGHGVSVGGGYIGGVNWTMSPTNAGTQNAIGFGFFSPQIGASYNYTPDTLLGVPLIIK